TSAQKFERKLAGFGRVRLGLIEMLCVQGRASEPGQGGSRFRSSPGPHLVRAYRAFGRGEVIVGDQVTDVIDQGGDQQQCGEHILYPGYPTSLTSLTYPASVRHGMRRYGQSRNQPVRESDIEKHAFGHDAAHASRFEVHHKEPLPSFNLPGIGALLLEPGDDDPLTIAKGHTQGNEFVCARNVVHRLDGPDADINLVQQINRDGRFDGSWFHKPQFDSASRMRWLSISTKRPGTNPLRRLNNRPFLSMTIVVGMVAILRARESPSSKYTVSVQFTSARNGFTSSRSSSVSIERKTTSGRSRKRF